MLHILPARLSVAQDCLGVVEVPHGWPGKGKLSPFRGEDKVWLRDFEISTEQNILAKCMTVFASY